MQLTVLLTSNHRLLSLVAAVDVFENVNQILAEEGSEKRVIMRIAGISEKPAVPDHLSHIPYVIIDEASAMQHDVVIIPAFGNYNMEQNIKDNFAFIPFLIQQQKNGVLLASLCTGSFLLAAAGLLNGRNATTHMEAAPHFAKAFPDVKLLPHAVITQDENMYTSGGATSSFHLKLYLIQQFCGRDIAIRAAKKFAIDMDRSNQLHFDYFKPGLVNNDELVRAVQVAIKNHYGNLKNVEDAFDAVPASRRNLIRRFKHATGITPIKYLQKTKIEAAKHLLETTNKDVLAVMVASGYSDMKNFRQLFKAFTGLTPTSYREKYGMRLG